MLPFPENRSSMPMYSMSYSKTISDELGPKANFLLIFSFTFYVALGEEIIRTSVT